MFVCLNSLCCIWNLVPSVLSKCCALVLAFPQNPRFARCFQLSLIAKKKGPYNLNFALTLWQFTILLLGSSIPAFNLRIYSGFPSVNSRQIKTLNVLGKSFLPLIGLFRSNFNILTGNWERAVVKWMHYWPCFIVQLQPSHTCPTSSSWGLKLFKFVEVLWVASLLLCESIDSFWSGLYWRWSIWSRSVCFKICSRQMHWNEVGCWAWTLVINMLGLHFQTQKTKLQHLWGKFCTLCIELKLLTLSFCIWNSLPLPHYWNLEVWLLNFVSRELKYAAFHILTMILIIPILLLFWKFPSVFLTCSVLLRKKFNIDMMAADFTSLVEFFLFYLLCHIECCHLCVKICCVL